MDAGSHPPKHDAPPMPAPLAPPAPGGGVDPTLIRWMLALTPEERLRWLDNVLRTLREVRRGT